MIILSKNLKHFKTKRSGIIPFTVKNGHLYFLLTIDLKTKQLSDFGGGVKKNENSFTSAIREFKEESNGIFDKLYYEQNFINTIAILNKIMDMSIIFLPINKEWFKNAPISFKQKINKEVYNLLWIDQNTFLNLIDHKNKKMWSKIQNFFKGTNCVLELFKNLTILYQIQN